MKTHFLSREEREIGSKYYYKHSFFNGLGFGFIAETTVYLLVIYFNATNVQLGYISSIIHVSGVILIFIPRLTRGITVTR